MKIASLEIENYPPIKHIKIEDLGNTVIIAGANGAGKTRLKQAIIDTFQGSPALSMTIKATREEEKGKYFQGDFITTTQGTQNPTLLNYSQSRSYSRGQFVGALIQIDSNRSVETVRYNPVNWLGGDPDDVESSITYYYTTFTNRWGEFMNYIHQKSAARDKKLADELKRNPKNGEQIIEMYPDPLEKYKAIFASVLPGKELQDINPASPTEFSYTEPGGTPLPFSSLSSGEQEVVKVLFDVARKEIKHSVILVDEPELHLHPTLAFKLIESLKSIGDHTNQYIFLTHSADLISTYYSTGDVYFLDSNQSGANQAHRLSELTRSHDQVIQLMGQNLGLFAVGKKLVFIEGEESSVDRLTYHAISQVTAPEARVLPVGSVSNLVSLNALEGQIRNSIFGIDIYMIRDRDGLSSQQILEIEASGRIFCLKRRHIENYFLDADVLSQVTSDLYLNIDGPSDKDAIRAALKLIAEESFNFNLLQNAKDFVALNHAFEIPTVRDVNRKDVQQVKDEIIQAVSSSLVRFSSGLDDTTLKDWLLKEETRLRQLLNDGGWESEFQGKVIFSKFCADFLKEKSVRIRQAYVDIALRQKPEVFADITSIFLRINT